MFGLGCLGWGSRVRALKPLVTSMYVEIVNWDVDFWVYRAPLGPTL